MLKSFPLNQNQVLRQLLRRIRQRKHLRQADLALRLGRGQSEVSKIERGVQRLDVIELRDWLAALEVDFLAFMTELNQDLASVPSVNPMHGSRRRRPHPSGDRKPG
jgi:transcriptional regulator with XRE-family HTH domain